MESIEFPISLIIGIIVIANFAYRQLDQPIKVASNSPVLRLNSKIPSKIGPRNFLEAYIYYLTFTLGGYFILCFSETFYSFVIQQDQSGAQTPGFDPSSPSWPLYVALIIVGLSPNFPILKDVESFFRSLAQRSAGIPRNFERYFDRITKFSFAGLPTEDRYIDEEVLNRTKIFVTILNCSKLKYTEAPRLERRIARFFILYYLSISPNSPVRWQSNIPLELVNPSLKDKAEEAREAFNTLYDDANAAEWLPLVHNIAATSAVSHGETGSDEPVADAALSAHAEDIDTFAERIYRAVEDDLEPHMPDVEAAFCFLFSNDPMPRYVARADDDQKREIYYADPGFLRLREHLLPFSAQTTRNIMAITIFVMSLAVFVLTPIVKTMLSNQPLAAGLLAANYAEAGLYAAGTIVLFGSAIIAATSFRRVRFEAGKFVSFADSKLFPMLQYINLFLVSFLFTVVSQHFVWMLYYFDVNKAFGQNVAEYYQSRWWIITAFSLVGALFACVFVAWLQRASEVGGGHSFRRLFMIRFSQAVLFSLITAAMSIIIYIVTAPQDVADLLTPGAPGSRIGEVLVAFLASLVGLTVSGWHFTALTQQREATQ